MAHYYHPTLAALGALLESFNQTSNDRYDGLWNFPQDT